MRDPMKKPYVKPAIVFAEKVESRAVVCAKVNQVDCPSGPVTS